jgi:hypothetical protein
VDARVDRGGGVRADTHLGVEWTAESEWIVQRPTESRAARGVVVAIRGYGKQRELGGGRESWGRVRTTGDGNERAPDRYGLGEQE